jgi:quinol monooxygenase YgiN
VKKFLFTSSFVLRVAFISLAQNETPCVRIVNIVIDSSQVDSFKAALKKDIEASVFTEPGMIAIHAVFDKVNPTHVTVFEIYENIQAHKTHQESDHFQVYKQATTTMVQSIVRIKVSAIALESKQISASPKNQ